MIDDLLREAGARWRAEQPPVSPDLTLRTPARWRRHLPVVAAVAAVLLVVAGVLIAREVVGHESAPAIGPASLVLHDGDTAEATGLVVAVPGKPVLFCPEMPNLGSTDPLGTCGSAFAVTATGVDLARLADREGVAHGTIKGRALLRGAYSHGTLRVTRQLLPLPPPTHSDPRADLPAVLRSTPCAPPSGRWHGTADTAAIGAYIAQDPDRFNGVAVTYPYEPHFTVTVAVVGVFRGDLAQAQRDLRTRFGQNVCVVRFGYSVAEQRAAMHQLDPLIDDRSNGIYAGGGGPGNFRPVNVDIDRLTPQRFEKLRKIGLHELEIHAWLVPVR